MTTANKITILRILLVPFFIGLVHYYIDTGDEWFRILAVSAFATAALSDGLDGYIARRYNQRSELGAILDPLADKLLLVSAIVLLSLETKGHFARIPAWLTTTVLSRDVLLLIGLVVIHYTFGKVYVRPRLLGKLATVLQMAVVVWILMKWSDYSVRILHWLELSATWCTGLAGLLYIWDGMKQLSLHPTSGPAERQ
jgi:CDP-diacylglycerol--glycerol-3-phosphate 3-phosphatidyltransferase